MGLSPAQLLMGRRLKNELPMMESLLTPTSNNQNEISKHLMKTKEQKKRNDDRYASKSMQELKQGTNVRMQPETDSKLWRTATVLRHHHTPRSYVVQNGDGRNYRRNRQHLRVCPAPEQEINPELSLENRANLTVAKEESNQAAPPAVLPDPPSQERHSQLPKESSGTPYVTRRDRQVVKPNRLDFWALGQFKDCERHFFIKERWQLHFLLSLLLVIAIAKCQQAKISGAVATTDSFFTRIGSHLRGTAVGMG